MNPVGSSFVLESYNPIAEYGLEPTIEERFQAALLKDDTPTVIELLNKHDRLYFDVPSTMDFCFGRYLGEFSLLAYAIKKKDLELSKCLLNIPHFINEFQEDFDDILKHISLPILQVALDKGVEMAEVSNELIEEIKDETLLLFLYQNRTYDQLNDYLSDMTPLMKAVLDGHMKVLEYLVIRRVDLEKKHLEPAIQVTIQIKETYEGEEYSTCVGEDAGIEEKTALQIAIGNRNLRAVELLLSAGANPDAVAKGDSCLHMAVHFGEVDILKCLIRHKANPNVIDQTGYTPLFRAQSLKDEKIIEELKSVTSSDYHTLHDLQRMLGHRFGLKNFTTKEGNKITLEGNFSFNTYAYLVKSLKRFIKKKGIPYGTILDKEVWNQVLNPITKAQENTSLFLREDFVIDPLKVYVIPSGWYMHATGLVLFQNTLIKANRGDACGDSPGLHLNTITNAASTKEGIRKVLSMKDQAAGKGCFTKTLERELGLKLEKTIRAKFQKVGNCAWASAKINLRAVFFIILQKNGSSIDEATRDSERLYKEWSTYDRRVALKKYNKKLNRYLLKQGLVAHPEFPQETLMEKIQQKCKSNQYFKDCLPAIEKANEERMHFQGYMQEFHNWCSVAGKDPSNPNSQDEYAYWNTLYLMNI